MKIVQTRITDIKPYEKNPRKNDKAVDKVAKSIEQYGFQQPIVVDKDMVIIVGHTRYKAAKKLGLADVPVVIADTLTDKEAQAYRIADNKTGEYADWDMDVLVEEIKDMYVDLSISNIAEFTAFTESEISKLLDLMEETSINVGLTEEQYKSIPGTLWHLGEHKLYHGSSTDSESLQILLGSEKIDMVWEDPPYGVDYGTPDGINKSAAENAAWNEKNKIANDALNEEELDRFIDKHTEVLVPYLREGAPLYWAHDIRFNYQFASILKKYKIHVADTLIWRKNTHSTWLADYAKVYEPIIYGWNKGDHKFYANTYLRNANVDTPYKDMSKEQLLKIVESIPTNYQEVDRASKQEMKLHPTVKPPKLIANHIRNSSLPGDIVYDGFAGSGSTLMACESTNRRARCIELEAKYIDAIIRRWQEMTGLQAENTDGEKWDDLPYSD